MPTNDEEEQILHNAVMSEVGAIFEKHQVGGTVLVVTKETAAWTTILPTWSSLQRDPEHGMRLRLTNKDPDHEEKLRITLHWIGSVADFCTKWGVFYTRFFEQLIGVFKRQGIDIDHEHLKAEGKARYIADRMELIDLTEKKDLQ